MTFCLEDLFTDVSGMLKSAVIVFLSISHFMSASACFMYLGAPLLGAYMLMNIISSSCIEPFFFLFFILVYGVLVYHSLWPSF